MFFFKIEQNCNLNKRKTLGQTNNTTEPTRKCTKFNTKKCELKAWVETKTANSKKLQWRNNKPGKKYQDCEEHLHCFGQR